jgi:hypothetical protein
VYRKDKEDEFKAEFPALIRDTDIFCVSYPDGWDGVLRELCQQLEAFRVEQLPDLEVVYVKQKFASLRVVYRSHVLRGRYDETKDLDDGHLDKVAYRTLRDELQDIIFEWEAKSLGVCEICGAGFGHTPDIVAKPVSVGGWERTLCRKHYLKECEKRGVNPEVFSE